MGQGPPGGYGHGGGGGGGGDDHDNGHNNDHGNGTPPEYGKGDKPPPGGGHNSDRPPAPTSNTLPDQNTVIPPGPSETVPPGTTDIPLPGTGFDKGNVPPGPHTEDHNGDVPPGPQNATENGDVPPGPHTTTVCSGGCAKDKHAAPPQHSAAECSAQCPKFAETFALCMVGKDLDTCLCKTQEVGVSCRACLEPYRQEHADIADAMQKYKESMTSAHCPSGGGGEDKVENGPSESNGHGGREASVTLPGGGESGKVMADNHGDGSTVIRTRVNTAGGKSSIRYGLNSGSH